MARAADPWLWVAVMALVWAIAAGADDKNSHDELFAVKGGKRSAQTLGSAFEDLSKQLRGLRAELAHLQRPPNKAAAHSAAAAAGGDHHAEAIGGIPSTATHHALHRLRNERRIFVGIDCLATSTSDNVTDPTPNCAKMISHLFYRATYPADVYFGILTTNSTAIYDALSQSCNAATATMCITDQVRFRTIPVADRTKVGATTALSMWRHEPFIMLTEPSAVDAVAAWDEFFRGIRKLHGATMGSVVVSYQPVKTLELDEASKLRRPVLCDVQFAAAPSAASPLPAVIALDAETSKTVRTPFASPSFIFGSAVDVVGLAFSGRLDASVTTRVWQASIAFASRDVHVVVPEEMPIRYLELTPEGVDSDATSPTQAQMLQRLEGKEPLMQRYMRTMLVDFRERKSRVNSALGERCRYA